MKASSAGDKAGQWSPGLHRTESSRPALRDLEREHRESHAVPPSPPWSESTGSPTMSRPAALSETPDVDGERSFWSTGPGGRLCTTEDVAALRTEGLPATGRERQSGVHIPNARAPEGRGGAPDFTSNVQGQVRTGHRYSHNALQILWDIPTMPCRPGFHAAVGNVSPEVAAGTCLWLRTLTHLFLFPRASSFCFSFPMSSRTVLKSSSSSTRRFCMSK